MVAPLREIRNKHFLSSTKMDSTSDMTLPTVNAPDYIGMDFLNAVRNTSNNYNKVRDHTLAPDKPSFKETSISSTVLLVTYHDRMTMNNDNDSNAIVKIIDGGLYFIFSFYFYFTLLYFFFFFFLFLEQLGLGFICHAVTASHKTDHGT